MTKKQLVMYTGGEDEDEEEEEEDVMSAADVTGGRLFHGTRCSQLHTFARSLLAYLPSSDYHFHPAFAAVAPNCVQQSSVCRGGSSTST